MADKQLSQEEKRRQTIIQGILDIHRRLLNGMDDMELQTMLITAWRLQGAKPGDTEVMDEIDIGFIGKS